MSKEILYISMIPIKNVEDRNIFTDLIRCFLREGHRITVICPTERKEKEKTRVERTGNLTLLHVKIFNYQKTNVIEKGLSLLTIQFLFRKAMLKYLSFDRLDLVYYSTPPITIAPLVKFIKNRYQCKTYLLLKDIFPQNAVDLGYFSKNSPTYRYFNWVEHNLYRISDHIGCMSPRNKEYILQHNPQIDADRIEINPNSIEPRQAFQRDRNWLNATYGIPTKPHLFVYGGNLGKPQAIDFLLDAIDSVKNRHDIFFFILGDGTERPLIEKRQKELPNLKWLPFVPKQEFQEILTTADAGLILLDPRFTIPNFPSRLLAYLEAKIPVFLAVDQSTDIGQIVEEGGFGIASESGNLAHFKIQLDLFLSKQENWTHMGQLGHSFLQTHYHVTNTFNLIIQKIT
ncbi:MAG: glycosyltransferase family 4 protein [Spirosomataceae bacterium]